jgi:hypothetical protein
LPSLHPLKEWSLQDSRGGSLVYVEGHLRGRAWTAKDGATRRSVEIVGENVQFLSSRAAGAEKGCLPLTPCRQRFRQLPRRGPGRCGRVGQLSAEAVERCQTVVHRCALVVAERDVLAQVGTAMWLRVVTEPAMADEPVQSLVVSGGGARNRLNSLIAAAIFGRPVLIPEVVEAGALGSALLAAMGVGLVQGCAETASAWVRIRAVEEPDPELVRVYQGLHERFTRTECVMRSLETPGVG